MKRALSHPIQRRFLQQYSSTSVNRSRMLLLQSSAKTGDRPRWGSSSAILNSGDGDGLDGRKQLWFYFDTVFPLKISRWDVRYLLAEAEKESLLERIRDKIPSDTGHAFRVEDVVAREKDGGAFVRCSYIPDSVVPGQRDTSVDDIERTVVQGYNALGERPWYSWRTSQAHLVRGKPWQEDIVNFCPSNTVRVEFESGPELSQEEIYELFRPFGRIKELEPQPASSKDLPRYCNVTYVSTRMAAAARNSLYGYKADTPRGTTVLRILYKERAQSGRAFRDWMTSHPRIVIPILAVLAGGLSYAIFDPIRSFFIKSKVSGLFDPDRYRFTKWLKRETIGRLNDLDRKLDTGIARLAQGSTKKQGSLAGDSVAGSLKGEAEGNADFAGQLGTGIERERLEAAEKLRAWLNDMPDSFITVNGPPGSGKSPLVRSVTHSSRNILIIDCSEIVKAGRGSDSKLVGELASQLGYFPQFQWASSFNNLIDIASVGLIGTKAGFSTNLDVQIKQVLDVAAAALKKLSDDAKLARERAGIVEREKLDLLKNESGFVRNVQSGNVHDGRLDCLAGNGIMGELGMGIESSQEDDENGSLVPIMDGPQLVARYSIDPEGEKEVLAVRAPMQSQRALQGFSQIYGPKSFYRALQASTLQTDGSSLERDINTSSTADIEQMPVVVIKGFDSKDGGTRDILWTAMADWAATLVENKIAHCIFINDSVIVSRQLAKALPSKPFNSVVLTDASAENAMQYVQKKLREYGKEELASNAKASDIARLGGRLTDLETLIQKMRGGSEISEAVDDIIARSATEIVKNCFGDDSEEAKNLPWTREQAWFLVKKLSKDKELSYADLLAGGPFKDQEKALRALEQAEIVMIMHRDGHAAIVRPGKPSYRSAFALLANNEVFSAQNELALNSKAVAGAQASIKSAQEELIQLSQLFSSSSGKWVFGGSPTIPVEIAARVDECLNKMHKAQEDAVRLGIEAKELKAKLVKI